MLPLSHAPAWLAASALLIVAVVYASLAPIAQPALPTHFDKVEHAFAYAILVVWFTGLVARPRYWIVAAGLAMLGLVIEFLQAMMPFGREGDPWDMASNAVGIGAGLVFATWITGGWALRVESWLKRN